MPPTVKALIVSPQTRPRLRAPTYRLRLERETPGGGETLHVWSGIPHERVGPLLHAMQNYLPWLARAAAARDAFTKVMDLFR